MGVGKSTLGKSLSIRLKMNFIDTDKIIEENEKATINDIFKNKGEDYFRKIEEKICLKSIKENNNVIALGGGAFMNDPVREVILKECISFWLDISVENLIGRSNNLNKRPLLSKNNLKTTLNDIYTKRRKIYNLANYKIVCDKITQKVILEKICNLYESN